MSVTIVNKYRHKPTKEDVYIGRGSPLGNPYPITELDSRDRVCDLYESWLWEKARDVNSAQHKAIQELIYKNREGQKINLVCFCAPKRCHGNTIKRIVEQYT